MVFFPFFLLPFSPSRKKDRPLPPPSFLIMWRKSFFFLPPISPAPFPLFQRRRGAFFFSAKNTSFRSEVVEEGRGPFLSLFLRHRESGCDSPFSLWLFRSFFFWAMKKGKGRCFRLFSFFLLALSRWKASSPFPPLLKKHKEIFSFCPFWPASFLRKRAFS